MTAPNLTARQTRHDLAAEVHVPLASGGVLSLSIEQAERISKNPIKGTITIDFAAIKLAEGFDLQGEIDRAKAAKEAKDLMYPDLPDEWHMRQDWTAPNGRIHAIVDLHEAGILVARGGVQAQFDRVLSYVKETTT